MVGKDVGVPTNHQISVTKQCDAASKKDSAIEGCINLSIIFNSWEVMALC